MAEKWLWNNTWKVSSTLLRTECCDNERELWFICWGHRMASSLACDIQGTSSVSHLWGEYPLQVGMSGKEPTCQCRRLRSPGLIPGSEKYPGVGHGYWLQCSCLESSMDGRAWQATVHRVIKSGTLLRRLSTHAHCPIFCYTCTHEKGRPVPITQRAIFSSQGNPKTHIALWVFAFAFFSRPSSRLLEVHQLCSLGTKEPRKNFRGAFHPGSPQPQSSQVWKRPLTFTFSRS